MTRRERLGLGILAACSWALALTAPLGVGTAPTWAATAAVLLLPGYLLDRRLGGNPHPLEVPARALALSLAMVTLLAAAVSLAGAAIAVLLMMLATATALLCLWPTGARAAKFEPQGAVHGLVLLAIAGLLVALAQGSDAVARDRMWYMAYLTALAEGPALSWSDPMLASGQTVWRFAYNGWLAALAAVQALSSARPMAVFEGTVPLLLAALVVSAALGLARAVCGPGPRATAATGLTVMVLLTTKWPFFSPERYPPFGRLAEDKTMALLVLAPVALAMFVSLVSGRPRSVGALVSFGMVLLATASAHPMVYIIVLGTAVSFSALSVMFAGDRGTRWREHIWALVIVGALAALPAYTGIQARSPLASQAVMSVANPVHPAVRSHIRMDRQLRLPVGGPVAHPRLLADPLLLAALGGLLLAWRRRQTTEGRYLLAASVPFVAVAFTPWLAPLFGHVVLPWMIYRALWALPFGLLLLTVLVEGTALVLRPGAGSRAPRLLAIALVATVALPRIDWSLPHPGTDAGRAVLDNDSAALMAAIAELPETSLIAAAPGLAELIPAMAGRPVLAFSDRGTTFFAGSAQAAARRLEANAVIGGLGRGSRRLRNATIASFDVTHSVVARAPCRHRSVNVFQAGHLALCMEREHRARTLRLRRTRAAAARSSGRVRVATLGGDKGTTRFLCRPAAETGQNRTFHWRRESRWSAKQLAVTCTAKFDGARQVERLRVVANLPRAAESLVYRIETTTKTGTNLSRQGTVELRGNPRVELPVPGHWSTQVSVRLVPSHLPYLNLVSLELLGPPE
ncbi:MAG: hypothetical protein VCB80_08240 [Deltaproteobacteria bacterium]